MNFYRFKTRAKREFRLNYKRWILVGLAALATKYVLLTPFFWLPEGWTLVISAIVAAEVGIRLSKIYGWT